MNFGRRESHRATHQESVRSTTWTAPTRKWTAWKGGDDVLARAARLHESIVHKRGQAVHTSILHSYEQDSSVLANWQSKGGKALM